MTIQQLSDKTVIAKLDPQIWISEVMTRNMQGMLSGSVAASQFAEIVNWELSNMKLSHIEIKPDRRDAALAEYRMLVERWNALGDEKEIEIVWVKPLYS